MRNKKPLLQFTLIFAAGLFLSQLMIFGEHRMCKEERDFLMLTYLAQMEKVRFEKIEIMYEALMREAEIDCIQDSARTKIDSMLVIFCQYEDIDCHDHDSSDFQKKELLKASFSMMQDLRFLFKKQEKDTVIIK